MKVSMRDVANHASVSVATVSNVINNTRNVSPQTRERVLQSIHSLGYFPDQIGRFLKTGKKNLIGFIVPDISNPVWALIIEEVEAVLSEQGNKLIIVNTKETAEREIENIRILASGIVDGLIIASTLTDFSQIEKIVPTDFPMVFIDRVIPNCPCDSIIPQDYNAIYEGVEQFILAGHRRIGFISGLIHLSTSQVRLNAYKNAMADYNIPIEDGYIQYGNSLSKGSIPLIQALLNLGCTALVVSNNVMAGDVLRYLNQKGISIGKDILILGQAVENNLDYNLNDIDLMVQPSAEIGAKAGQLILERINAPGAPIKNIVLYSRLIKQNRMPAI